MKLDIQWIGKSNPVILNKKKIDEFTAIETNTWVHYYEIVEIEQ